MRRLALRRRSRWFGLATHAFSARRNRRVQVDMRGGGKWRVHVDSGGAKFGSDVGLDMTTWSRDDPRGARSLAWLAQPFLTAPLPEGMGFPLHRAQPMLPYSNTGLTASPWADTASPAAKMLRAALTSRSCCVPHCGHVQVRTDSGIESLRSRHPPSSFLIPIKKKRSLCWIGPGSPARGPWFSPVDRWFFNGFLLLFRNCLMVICC